MTQSNRAMRASTAPVTRLLMIAAGLYAATSIAVVAQTPTRSLWDGVFTMEQADRGRVQYAVTCARCHGGRWRGRFRAP